jgi:hypothetical protein
VFAIDLWILVGSILPHVRDPLPDSIGLGFPFAMAGAWGVLAEVIYTDSSSAQRDQAIRKGGVYGFRFGVVIYVLSLLVQLTSEL